MMTKAINRQSKIFKSKYYQFYVILFIFMIGSSNGFSQERTFDVAFENAKIEDVLNYIKSKSNYSIVYTKGLFSDAKVVSLTNRSITLKQLLDEVLVRNSFLYEIRNQVIVIRKGESMTDEGEGVLDQIEGAVYSSDGEPLAGATILIKGTNKGVVTDIDGHFELKNSNIKKGSTLTISYIGNKTKEIILKGQSTLNITMQEDIASIEEVVVMGYSSKKSSEITGAIQKFDGDDVEKNSVSGNVFDGLKGQTTGLQISGSSGIPGKDGDLLLRGKGTLFNSDIGSLRDNTENISPLIVIDGVITNYTSLNGIVSPQDIEDITVLKDASSTAIYGSRAATGVIVVTTKKGKVGKMNIAFKASTGVSQPYFGKTKYMTSQQLYQYGLTAVGNWWENNQTIQTSYPDKQDFIDSKLGLLVQNYNLNQTNDWRKLTYRTGTTQDYNVAVSGGAEKIKYYFSYNFFEEQGVFLGYDLSRNMIKTRMDFEVTKNFEVGVNTSASFSTRNSPNYSNSESYHPWLNPYDDQGNLAYSLPFWGSNYSFDADKVNVLQDSKYNSLRNKNINLFGSFYGTIRFTDWLTFTSTNTFTLNDEAIDDYKDSRTYDGNHPISSYSNGTLRVTDSRNSTFLTSNVIRVKRYFGEHSLQALVGQEWYTRHIKGTSVPMYDQVVTGERNVGGFSKVGVKTNPSVIPTGQEFESGSFSLFSELNYSYKDKYFLSGSFRTDASTNFGKNNRYGNFYSMGGAWNVTREKFLENSSILSLLKLRMNYGTSGKEAGIDFLNYTLYDVSQSPFNYYLSHPEYQSNYRAVLMQLGNPDLSWEKAHTFDVGVDIGLVDNKVYLTADFYKRINSNLIMPVTLSASHGIGRQFQNVGEMENSGIELSLKTSNISTENFSWNSTLTFSYNKNKITKLYDDVLIRNNEKPFYVGDNIDMLKKVKVLGVDSQTGLPMYQKVNQNGSTSVVNSYLDVLDDSNFVDVGLARAPYFGGITQTLKYKNLEFYVRGSYAFDYKRYNPIKGSYSSSNYWTLSNLYQLSDDLTIWEQPGDLAQIPVLNDDPTLSSSRILNSSTSFPYSDASHFSIDNIQLTYNFSKVLLDNLSISNASVSIMCNNVYTFTNKEFAGLNPEGIGIDTQATFPNPRRYSLVLRFNL